MKHYIIWALVILFGSQSVLFAQEIDTDKLLMLKPLCSERINKQASDFRSNRFRAIGTFALVGVGLLSINYSGIIDDNKLGALSVGLSSVIGGTLAFFSRGDQVVKNETFWSLDLKGTDREVAAYAIMKNSAAQSRDNRKGSGFLLVASGLGVALLTALASGATQSYKTNMYLGAALNLALGLQAYNNPGEREKEMEQIDSMIEVSL